MFDINKEIDYILKKYKLNENVLLRDRINSAIRSIISEYTKKYGKRIIVRGLKPSVNNVFPLLEIISDYGDIVAIVDKNPFTEKVRIKEEIDIKMYNTDHANGLECDVYIVNSKYQGKNILNEMNCKGKRYCVIDLYTEMRIRYGILLTKTIDEYNDEKDFSHHKTHEVYELFIKEKNEQNLKKVVCSCLINRDFVTFYDVLDEAKDLIIENKWFTDLRNEISQLLNHIKILINDRRNNSSQDIIMHWIDQVGFEELGNFPKLDFMMKKGLYFENAYAVTPYTIATETCIFFEDTLSNLNKINLEKILSERKIDESKLYHDIHEKGYAFFMVGGVVEDCMPDKKNEYTQWMVASSVHYWNMINYMINSISPIFGIVGCLAETHEPWMSPKCNVYNPSFEFFGSYEMSKEKIKKSACYYDNTIEFFSDLLGENTINIYMSDHGKWEDIDLRRYSDYAMHTILSVTNLGVNGKVSRVFSYKYFSDLINYIMDAANKKTQEHIFGDMELRSPGFKAAIKKRIAEEYHDEHEIEKIYAEICSGYIGIKTETDTYIRLDTGHEIYFSPDKIDVNRTKEENDISCINLLRKKMEKWK